MQVEKQKYMATVSYDGSAYSGFQIQPNARTIQGELERVLAHIHNHPLAITGSGRTDAGVHACGQVFHFESSKPIAPGQWVRALNAYLPDDIRIQQVTPVDASFHARFDAKWKEYRYFILNREVADPLQRMYRYHVQRPLNIAFMRQATHLLVGTHNFEAFSSAKSDVTDKVRCITTLDIVGDGAEWAIVCVGNGFLYNMVRIIVGTLIDIGHGKRSLEDVRHALQYGKRDLAGPTAPAHGLCLWQVGYQVGNNEGQ